MFLDSPAESTKIKLLELLVQICNSKTSAYNSVLDGLGMPAAASLHDARCVSVS
jgi:hypothetical protein